MNLLTDITKFRDLITYYEGRVLRCEIALAEILHSKESRENRNSQLPSPSSQPNG